MFLFKKLIMKRNLNVFTISEFYLAEIFIFLNLPLFHLTFT